MMVSLVCRQMDMFYSEIHQQNFIQFTQITLEVYYSFLNPQGFRGLSAVPSTLISVLSPFLFTQHPDPLSSQTSHCSQTEGPTDFQFPHLLPGQHQVQCLPYYLFFSLAESTLFPNHITASSQHHSFSSAALIGDAISRLITSFLLPILIIKSTEARYFAFLIVILHLKHLCAYY